MVQSISIMVLICSKKIKTECTQWHIQMEVLMRPALIGINTIRNVGLDLKIHSKEQFHSIILAMHGLPFFRTVLKLRFSDELSKRCRRGGAREREWNNSKTLKRWYHLKGGLILCTMWWMLILSFHSYTLFSWLSLVHSSWSICAWLLSQHNLAKQSNENSDWWKKRDWNSCQMIQHSLLIRIVFKMFTI